jgi:hypothetical protein
MAKAAYARAVKDARKRAGEIRKELASFSKSSRVFSSDSPRLIDQYEDKWIAVHDGKVAAADRSLAGVTSKVEKKGIPLGETMIRRIERRQKTFIL